MPVEPISIPRLRPISPTFEADQPEDKGVKIEQLISATESPAEEEFRYHGLFHSVNRQYS